MPDSVSHYSELHRNLCPLKLKVGFPFHHPDLSFAISHPACRGPPFPWGTSGCVFSQKLGRLLHQGKNSGFLYSSPASAGCDTGPVTAREWAISSGVAPVLTAPWTTGFSCLSKLSDDNWFPLLLNSEFLLVPQFSKLALN